jgi:hypothetical protein
MERILLFFCKISFNQHQQQLIETLIGRIDTDETDFVFYSAKSVLMNRSSN